MRVEPGQDSVLRRMARAFPAGTMGGTRRPDPIRERAQVTPTQIAQPGGGCSEVYGVRGSPENPEA